MRTLFADRDLTLVLGILNDKEYHEIVNILVAAAQKVIFTKPLYDFKATAPEELAKALESYDKEAYVVHNCIEALQLAQKITATNGVILCTGSLYLVGDIRRFIND
jgi:dihydrofolate synthase/folylpolyglutamate synthase